MIWAKTNLKILKLYFVISYEFHLWKRNYTKWGKYARQNTSKPAST